MRVLVAGGAGYIGSHTVKALLKHGFEVIIFDNFSTGHRELVRGGTLVQGDLMNKHEVMSALHTYPCDAVMHFASLIQVGESFQYPHKYYTANLVSTLNLLEAMQAAQIRRFIFSSSAAIYGVPDFVPITESHALRPENPYGNTKLFVETILNDYARAYGLKFIALRYFNAAGADPDTELGEMHEPETHLIPNILRSLLEKNRPLEIHGTDFPTPDGTAIRDYIHVADLAEAHVRALKNLLENQGGGSINLGSNQGYSVRQVIAQAESVTGRLVKYKAGLQRKGDVPILLASKELAEKSLGWKLQHSDLETIIRTAWAWHSRLLGHR